MIDKTKWIYFLCCGVLFSGCISTIPAIGVNLNYNGEKTTLKGEASYLTVLNLFTWGDGSITAAMKAGGIDKIHHIDIETDNYLIAKKITIVWSMEKVPTNQNPPYLKLAE
jgi:hypothetical protein